MYKNKKEVPEELLNKNYTFSINDLSDKSQFIPVVKTYTIILGGL